MSPHRALEANLLHRGTLDALLTLRDDEPKPKQGPTHAPN